MKKCEWVAEFSGIHRISYKESMRFTNSLRDVMFKLSVVQLNEGKGTHENQICLMHYDNFGIYFLL